MKSSKQTPPDPLECSREHEFNHLSRVRHIHLLQEALHPDTPPLTGCDPQKQACEFICITICTRAYEKSANANGIKPRANVSPRSDDWPEWLHLQRGFSYSGQPATEDGHTQRETESETLDTWHYDPRELRQAASYSFCCPGDHMQTVVCGFDVHALQDDKRNVN